MSTSKRLLLIAYYYPPRPGVGSRRPAQLRKYLPRYGWEVTVLTARMNGNGATSSSGVVATKYVDVLASVKRRLGLNGTLTHERFGVDVPYGAQRPKSLRHRVISLAYQACTFPDREVGWSPFAFRALKDALRRERFDAVMTTSPPYVAGIVAALADSGVPWIADMRDLWTGADVIARDRPVRWLERKLERWMLRRASAITVVSRPMEAYLAREFPSVPVETIYNAFDPDDWLDVPFDSNDRCTLLFAGSFYRGRLHPQELFRAVRRLIDRGELLSSDLRIDMYSDEAAWVEGIARSEGLTEVVRSFGYVSHDEITRLERRADRLLLFGMYGLGAETIVSGRIFEYLGARKPVLAVGGVARSAMDDVLREARAGARAITDAQIESEVIAAVREFKERRASILAPGDVAVFDALHMAKHTAEFLDHIIESRSTVTP